MSWFKKHNYGLIWGLFVLFGCLLRVVRLGAHELDFDETFTATAALLPVRNLVEFLRFNDSHPPFDYLLRAPLVRAGANAALVRLPSALMSIAALLVFAVWATLFGRRGLVGIVIAAGACFPVTYAFNARMYATMLLVGVVVAFAAYRWQNNENRAADCYLTFAALTIGCLNHISGVVLAFGAFTFAGFRNDSWAWRWRIASALPVLVWASVWGRSFMDQASGRHADWIPLSNPRSVAIAINELIDSYPVLSVPSLGLLVVGLVLLCRRDATLFRVVVCIAGIPIAAFVVLGIKAHVLLPRSLAFAWWAVPLLLAVVVLEAFKRSKLTGVLAASAVVVLMVPSTAAVYGEKDSAQVQAVNALFNLASPGDYVGINPYWLSPLLKWRLQGATGAKSVSPSRSFAADDVATNGTSVGLSSSAYVAQVSGASSSQRLWLLIPDTYSEAAPGWVACEPAGDRTFDNYIVRCLTRP